MAIMNLTGWNIRRIRIEKGMTVNQLSSALPKSSPLTSEMIGQIELANRKLYDQELLAISKVLGVSIEDLYATSPKKTSPEDVEAWKILVQLEDIISGIEAEADNLGLNLEEVRHWWQEARRLIDRRNLALSKPSKASTRNPFLRENGGQKRAHNERTTD